MCIFDGVMEAAVYTQILDQTLVPFINDVYPSSHRFMADNHPKHTSLYAQKYLGEKGINWWRTPAELSDLNPIENMWHKLKEYIRREVKLKTKEELIDGIEAFWSTVDIDKCRKYIRRLHKVIPRVIELQSAATGY